MNNETRKGKLVPELRFPGFEGEWEEKSLGEIGSTYAGLSGKSKEDFVNGNAQYITFLNVLNNVVIDNTNHPTVKIKENENQNDVKYGDLLFNTSSETPEEVGFCAMMQDNKPNIYLNSFCFGYRFNVLKDYQPLFLAYYFRSSHGRRLMTKLAQGVTRYNLSKSNFLKAEIAFPSLPEQQKIAECLSSVDDMIQAEADQLQALKDHKKGLMQQLFPQEGETTPKLRFPGFEGEWEKKKLGDVFKRITRKNKENNKNVLTISAQYGLVSQIDFFNKSVAAADVTGYYLLEKGDFAYNKSSSSGNPVGVIKPLKMYDKGVVSTLYICFRCNNPASISFWEQYFNAGCLDAEIRTIAQEGARNHGLLNVPTSDFFTLTIIAPSLPEQQKIADCFSSLDEGIAAQQRKVEALKEHKKGLMQKLFPTIN